jgi:hypothetical protein
MHLIAIGAETRCTLGEQGKSQRNHLPWLAKVPTNAIITEAIDER